MVELSKSSTDLMVTQSNFEFIKLPNRNFRLATAICQPLHSANQFNYQQRQTAIRTVNFLQSIPLYLISSMAEWKRIETHNVKSALECLPNGRLTHIQLKSNSILQVTIASSISCNFRLRCIVWNEWHTMYTLASVLMCT